jgi:hypothetical protein
MTIPAISEKGGVMTDLEKASAKVKAAWAELHKANAALAAEIAAVNEKHRHGIRKCRDVLAAANEERNAAENAETKEHEWTGRLVELRNRAEVKRGIVYTYRHGDQKPSAYFSPEPGQPMVRLLKKDGTPGKRVEIMRDHYKCKWVLVDQESAA